LALANTTPERGKTVVIFFNSIMTDDVYDQHFFEKSQFFRFVLFRLQKCFANRHKRRFDTQSMLQYVLRNYFNFGFDVILLFALF
jgi:hypothetical protein